MAAFPNLRTWSNLDSHGRPGHIIRPLDSHQHEPTSAQPQPQAYVDTPQILYSNWPSQAGGVGAPLGKFNGTPPKIALIGGGLANCVAGLELAKAGADVTLIEAQGQVGGRLKSISIPGDEYNVEEMGAMRFPPSEDLLYYYAQNLGFTWKSNFPDPGVVSTLICYNGGVEQWQKQGESPPPPPGFETVYNGWVNFVENGVTNGGAPFLMAPAALTELLQSSFEPDSPNLGIVQNKWQLYLDTFGQSRFKDGMQDVFGANAKWDVPGGTPWSDDDFKRFGALGLGSGGFGVFYPLGFNTIIRIVVNGLETEQQTFCDGSNNPVGIQNLTLAIIQNATSLSNPLKVWTSTIAQVTNSTATSATVQWQPSGQGGQGQPKGSDTFDYVIVGTTNKVATELFNQFLQAGIVPEQVQKSLGVHITLSTKLFVRVEKFWQDSDSTPRVILTDQPQDPQLYALDYGNPNLCVVLVDYAWESDSKYVEHQPKDELFANIKGLLQQLLQNTAYSNWTNSLNSPDNMNLVNWQYQPLQQGGWVLAGLDQDSQCATLFYDFLKNVPNTPANWSPILLNGDCYGWVGGWTQGALVTALNNVSQILSLRGELNAPDYAPTVLLNPTTYRY